VQFNREPQRFANVCEKHAFSDKSKEACFFWPRKKHASIGGPKKACFEGSEKACFDT
jgi:hypothetical protein